MISDPIDLASLKRRIARRDDGELLQIRVGVIRRLLEDLFPPVHLESNRGADEPLRSSETGAAEWPGLSNADPAVGAQQQPQPQHGGFTREVTEHGITYRKTVYDDDLSRWDAEGGNGHNRG